MKKLENLAVTLAALAFLPFHVSASEVAANHPVNAGASEVFSPADLGLLFDRPDPSQLMALTQQEMQESEGAWINFVVGGGVGFATYAASNWYNDQPITWQGAAYSVATGAFVGGLGGALIGASGGGLAGNLAWRPNMLAANFGFSQYRGHQGW